MGKYKIFNKYKLLYVLADIISSFTISFIAFLSYYGFHFTEHLAPVMIYCSSISVVTVASFYIFKVYRIITKDIGIFDCLRIMIISTAVDIIGLIVLAVVPDLPDMKYFFFAWFLSSFALLFVYPSLRILVRIFNIASKISAKENRVKTIVIELERPVRLLLMNLEEMN